MKATIFTITGVPCLNIDFYPGDQINIESLPSGIYEVVIRNQDNETVTKKLVKIN